MINSGEYGRRAIAFLDILGFKNMVEELGLSQIAKRYESMIDQIAGIGNYYSSFGSTQKNSGLCKRYVFSDSIILIANEDSEDSFIDLITYTWRILQFSLANQMPIRGAISYGDIYMNDKLSVFLGKGLTDAYILEGKQQWIGVILDKIAEERYKYIFSTNPYSMIFNELLFNYDVPFKDGSNKTYRTFNWRLNLVVKNGTRSLFVNEKDDKGVQEKIENTLKFAQKVINRKQVYLAGDDLPSQYRTIWVGDTEPPFKHGDEL